MSFTTQIFERNIIEGSKKNQSTTLEQADLQPMLDVLDNFFKMQDVLKNHDEHLAHLWNQILVEQVGALYSATSGFYRQSISSLRDVFELCCRAIYFYDHSIEFYLYKDEDAKAEEYVTALVNEKNFYTSRYIKSFYPNISNIESMENSISLELTRAYKKLCDVVHCRYKKLDSKDGKVEFNLGNFKKFEQYYLQVLKLVAVVFFLRFQNDLKNESGIYIKYGEELGVFKK